MNMIKPTHPAKTRDKMRISILSFIALFGCVSIAKGNGLVSSYASTFNVAYLRQFSPTSQIDMIILTESASQVQFNISSLNGSIHNGTTTRDSPANITLSSTLQVRETTYDYRQLGLLVTSPPDNPISVVLVGWTTAGPRSAYLALPCIEQPVQEYVYYGVTAASKISTRVSQVLLVGCRDNTTVTITPTRDVQLPENPQSSSSSIINVAAGSSHTITLHSLQTLLIGAPNVDLNGTKIVSNYPLTVVGGHDCANIPTDVNDCDPISTQIPPTINWGTQYLLTPLNGRSNGQRFKVIASENNTSIFYTCTQSNSMSANEGDVRSFDTQTNHFCSCECSKPCYLSEFAFSRDVMFSNDGDPILMTVPPISQYPHSVTFTTQPGIPNNFYSIAVPADSYYNGTVIINGSLTTLNWTPIRDTNGVITGYGYNTTANGSYTISHSHPNGRIYVSAYGFSNSGGYGYLTGTELKPLLFVTFNSSNYFTTENNGEVLLYIERSNRLPEVLTVTVKTKSNATTTSPANENSDYIPINETITFSAGETVKTVTVTIIDDGVTEETEYFDVVIETAVDAMPFEIDRTTVVIEDNDSITFGFKSDLLSVSDRERVPIDVLLVSGNLQQGLAVVLTCEIESSQGEFVNVSLLHFQYGISELSVVFNSTQLALPFNLTVQLFAVDNSMTSQVNMGFNISRASMVLNPLTTVSSMASTKTSSSSPGFTVMSTSTSSMIQSRTSTIQPTSTAVTSSTTITMSTPVGSCPANSSGTITNNLYLILVLAIAAAYLY